jgi:hypothetical protein
MVVLLFSVFLFVKLIVLSEGMDFRCSIIVVGSIFNPPGFELWTPVIKPALRLSLSEMH